MDKADCKICGSRCNVIQKEVRKELVFTILKCTGCGTIQTLEHYGHVSPDYVDLTIEQVSTGHIVMGRHHKHQAYRQWADLSKKWDVNLDGSLAVLDVGCGTGGFLEFLRPAGVRAVGFDASMGQVEYCQSQHLDAERAVTTLDFLKLRPEFERAADVVTVWDVFEHIRSPLSFLEETKKLLSSRGILFISVPSAGAHAWKRPLHRIVRGSYSFDPWEHVFYYNPGSLKHVLNKAGYDCLQTGSVVCYQRPLNFGEAVRRASFAALEPFPSISPQLYAFARIKSRPD